MSSLILFTNKAYGGVNIMKPGAYNLNDLRPLANSSIEKGRRSYRDRAIAAGLFFVSGTALIIGGMIFDYGAFDELVQLGGYAMSIFCGVSAWAAHDAYNGVLEMERASEITLEPAPAKDSIDDRLLNLGGGENV